MTKRVLRGAGVRADFSEERVDRPHHDGLWRTKQKWDRAADRLALRFSYWARDLLDPPSFADGEIPELILTAKDRRLPGILEALATGAGLDWLTRAEAAQQGLTRTQIGEHKRLPSWRPLKRTDGCWLIDPGYRERMGLRTVLRPVLIRGYEDACMRLIGARWPVAEFLEPVVIEPTADGIANGEKNVRRMERFRGEILVAVDHAQIHWGSVLDLDLFFRQRGSYLSTVLASTYAVPDFAIRVLARL